MGRKENESDVKEKEKRLRKKKRRNKQRVGDRERAAQCDVIWLACLPRAFSVGQARARVYSQGPSS